MKGIEYKNLTELLLNVIRIRPGMYLGEDHLTKLPNLILGYRFSDAISQDEQDFYFGDRGFLTWYTNEYKLAPKSFWHQYFLEESGGDNSQALQLYFTRLEEYYDWYNSTTTDRS